MAREDANKVKQNIWCLYYSKGHLINDFPKEYGDKRVATIKVELQIVPQKLQSVYYGLCNEWDDHEI